MFQNSTWWLPAIRFLSFFSLLVFLLGFSIKAKLLAGDLSKIACEQGESRVNLESQVCSKQMLTRLPSRAWILRQPGNHASVQSCLKPTKLLSGHPNQLFRWVSLSPSLEKNRRVSFRRFGGRAAFFLFGDPWTGLSARVVALKREFYESGTP